MSCKVPTIVEVLTFVVFSLYNEITHVSLSLPNNQNTIAMLPLVLYMYVADCISKCVTQEFHNMHYLLSP